MFNQNEAGLPVKDPDNPMLNKKVKVKVLKVKVFRDFAHFSVWQLLVFALVFASIGGYLIFRGFAATTVVATVEAESMAYPSRDRLIADSAASGGQALLLAYTDTATKQVPLSAAVNQITVRAKGAQCNGAPQLVVKVDNVQVQTSSVSATSWTDYTAAVNLTSGTPTISVSFTNDYAAYDSSGKMICSRDLYVDKLTFYGSTSDTTPPTAPVLSATAGDKQVSLNWTAATDNVGVSSYVVWSQYVYITTLSSTARSYNVTGLTNGMKYGFHVVASDVAGNHTNSNSVSATPVASAPPPPNIVGGPGIAFPNIIAFDNTTERDNQLANAQLLGAKWIREDLGYEHNTAYDALVAGTTGRGMKVLAQMGSTGVNALGHAGEKYTPTTYLTVVNNEVPWYYAKGVRDFEILNEFNLNGYTAAQYLAIVQAAYPIIHQLAPDANVWAGAVGIGDVPCAAGCQFTTYVEPLFTKLDHVTHLPIAQESICNYITGFSIHAADMSHPPIGNGDRSWSMQSWVWGPTGDQVTETLTGSIGLMHTYCGADKPVLLSEYNFPDNKPAGPLTGQQIQADRVVDNICDSRYVGVANYTIWSDPADTSTTLFSMMTGSSPNYTKKLVWNAYKAATGQLAAGSTSCTVPY